MVLRRKAHFRCACRRLCQINRMIKASAVTASPSVVQPLKMQQKPERELQSFLQSNRTRSKPSSTGTNLASFTGCCISSKCQSQQPSAQELLLCAGTHSLRLLQPWLQLVVLWPWVQEGAAAALCTHSLETSWWCAGGQWPCAQPDQQTDTVEGCMHAQACHIADPQVHVCSTFQSHAPSRLIPSLTLQPWPADATMYRTC